MLVIILSLILVLYFNTFLQFAPVFVYILLSQADEDTELKKSKRTRKISKVIYERKTHSKTHHDKCKDPEPNSYEYSSAKQVSHSWNKKTCLTLPKQEGLRRVLSCPSQISVSSHVMNKQHKTSFAELAHYKKNERSPLLMKNNKEAPNCSLFSQNISPVQRKVLLGQNVTFITSKTEMESGRSGSPEIAGIPQSGKQTKCVILLRYIIFC